MTDFIMKTDENGVVFKANSNKARDWCVDTLQQMADPIYPEVLAPAMKALFEHAGFEVCDMVTRSSLDELI